MTDLLILGPSTISFTETAPEDSLAALIQRELSAGTDEPWRCQAELLYYGDFMAERTRTMLVRHRPDVVVVILGSYQFLHEPTVISRIEHMTPSVAKRFSRFYKPVLKQKWTGVLLAPLRAVAGRLIGKEPRRNSSEAFESAIETLDLLRAERIAFACMLPTRMAIDEPAQAAQREQFKSRIRAYCERQSIRCADFEAHLASHGEALSFATDLYHLGLPTRRQQAKFVAELARSAAELPASTIADCC